MYEWDAMPLLSLLGQKQTIAPTAELTTPQ
jgi:hypothetical protein